ALAHSSPTSQKESTMRRTLMGCLGSLLISGWAVAQDKPAGPPDMQNMGGMSRQPKKAQQDQAELKKFFKDWDTAWRKADLNAAADMGDFPVTMITDSSKGEFKMEQWNRDQWIGVMKPFMDPAMMKNMKWTAKETCFLLSDDLASCEVATNVQMGKIKGKVNSHNIVIRKDGKWKAKAMMEAGWGDAPSPKA